MYDSYLYRTAREYGEARMRDAANERLARQAVGLTGRLGEPSVLGPLRRRLEEIAGWLAAGWHMPGRTRDAQGRVAQGA